MVSTLTATDAARRFSDIVNRVRYRGERFLIERGGEAVCQIIPASPPAMTLSEFGSWFAALPRPDPEFWDDLAGSIENQADLPESPWGS